MRRKKLAVMLFLVPVLVGAGLLSFYYSRREDRSVEKTLPRTPVPSRPGGEGLVLEVFSAGGKRLWSLSFRAADLTAEEQVVAREIAGEYYAGASPASFRAAELVYDPAQRTLSLRRVVIDGPLGRILAGKLDWREGESFRLEGGYSLHKDGLTVTGERLSLAEDLSSFRAWGPVRLRWPMEGE